MPALHFNPETHTYTKDGVRLPHITGVLKLVQPTDFFTEEGRERGDAVHKAIKQYGENTPVVSMPPQYFGYIEAWHKFVRDHAYKSVLAEVPLWHPSGWAGTPDQYGIMDEQTSTVFEIKTGANHPSHALQTAAQGELIRVNGHKAPKLRFTLQLQPDGRYTIHTHREHSDLAMFLSLLNIYRWRQRHNML